MTNILPDDLLSEEVENFSSTSLVTFLYKIKDELQWKTEGKLSATFEEVGPSKYRVYIYGDQTSWVNLFEISNPGDQHPFFLWINGENHCGSLEIIKEKLRNYFHSHEVRRFLLSMIKNDPIKE